MQLPANYLCPAFTKSKLKVSLLFWFMTKSCFIIALLFCSGAVLAQSPAVANRFTLNGYTRDSLSGETISGVSISVNGESKGVASNAYGFYSITLEKGDYSINISHVS